MQDEAPVPACRRAESRASVGLAAESVLRLEGDVLHSGAPGA